MAKKNQVVFLEPGRAESFVLEGVQIDQLLPREVCEQFSAYLVRMEPFQIKKPSYHKKGEELYYVISGSGQAVLGGENYDLRAGCFFRVPLELSINFQQVISHYVYSIFIAPLFFPIRILTFASNHYLTQPLSIV